MQGSSGHIFRLRGAWRGALLALLALTGCDDNAVGPGTLRFGQLGEISVDLLDRSAVGLVAGARWGSNRSSVRFFGGLRWSEYKRLSSNDPTDPFRRDRTVRTGIDWTHLGESVFAQIGLEGTINRSNGNRPEYDALSASALVTTPLPKQLTLNLFVLLTGKSYVHEIDFARLVPGEEADNASIAYVEVGRPIAPNLNGAVRVGWTRAEIDIGNAYYERVGISIRLNYRPMG